MILVIPAEADQRRIVNINPYQCSQKSSKSGRRCSKSSRVGKIFLTLIGNVYTHADGNCTYVKSIVFGASSCKRVAAKTADKKSPIKNNVHTYFFLVWVHAFPKRFSDQMTCKHCIEII